MQRPHPHAHPPRQSRPPRTEQPSRSRPRRHRRRRVVLTALACAAVLVGAGPTALGGGASPALELTRAGAAPPAATARQVEALDRGVVSVHTDSGNLGGFNWSSQHPDLGGVRRGYGGLEFEDQRCPGGAASAVAR
ncbi:hypothetical protein QF032_006559 [Streptomyces achromogenes]|nr:hypothetical protein [Streptomyces achromogenes]